MGLVMGPKSRRKDRSRELQIALETLSAGTTLACEDQDHVGGDVTQFKLDDSPVTEADRDIENLIVDRLGTFFPKARFLGEEFGGSQIQEGLEGDLWIVDPIDGTTNYALGLSTFAISLGLLRDGEPVLGAIALPRTNEYYYCDFTGPARCNPRGQLQVVEKFRRHQFLCLPSSMLKYYQIDFAGNIRSFGSTVYHVLLVAMGVAAGAIVMPFAWDIAGVLPILRRAGGELFSFSNGEPLDMKRWAQKNFKPFPMVACTPNNFEKLRDVLVIRSLGT